ncbi:2-keto-3-deoxygluconate kinase [Halorientalis sp. IM1011]|uniref:bifunctional 2-dehydro-3-deoxygluconokinase/2-dehydro-3- deoxygalactonokinase n=1 Tax=Halorientalis sp. IM1011 TaxID=1932360 RepID=UPI00097CD651|nr:bifunctional 2-dehydro-3-deoxygluconokinase/2-dehydro-3-deoxygalactonokinase [Halorientalis sp. IM1011]AQL43438.1 2-keto-3-deoxygluconate kinase [Halorientalis sp. IM1011]
MPELATFGETMLRLSPPGDEPVETARTFEVHAAGAESNVAVAAQRLGVASTWLSKLPDSPPGRRVRSALRQHGVEPAVVLSEEGRQGTYYLESADQPRGRTVIYDREGAAVRTATAAELPTDRIERADAFHTTGITPALSETLATTTADLLEIAREADTTTVFDLNYRSKLWEPDRARETITDLLDLVDVFVVADRDAETVLGLAGSPTETAERLAADRDFETVVVTRGDEGAVAVHDGETHEQPAISAGDAHPVGTGDAFVGGFLASRLQSGSVPEALTYGAATAALKRTIPGDAAVVTPEAVEHTIEGGTEGIER